MSIDQQRSVNGRIGAHESWARTRNRAARTAAARQAAFERFERQVDPHGELPEHERQRLAEHERKAYFARLGKKSGEARRNKSA